MFIIGYALNYIHDRGRTLLAATIRV